MAASQQSQTGIPLGARIAGATLSDIAAGRTAIVAIRLRNDGSLELTQNTISFTRWYQGPSVDSSNPIGNLFWVRCVLLSGSPNPSGVEPLNTWLDFVGNTSRIWSWPQSTVGTITATVRIDIATNSSGTNIVANAQYTLTAQRTS